MIVEIKLIEEFATNALKIAKRLNDPVGIMARANDLREVYKVFPPKNDKFMSILYDEKHALNKISNSKNNVILLRGVTGSGKTEVARLIADILYENGTFRPLTEQEKVTSTLLMFSDILPE